MKLVNLMGMISRGECRVRSSAVDRNNVLEEKFLVYC